MGLQMPRPVPKVSGWTRPLEGDRLEIFLKAENVHGAPDRKIRASGPREEMYELVDWFEDKTGLRVDVPNRVRTGPAPIPGQTTLVTGDMTAEEAPVG